MPIEIVTFNETHLPMFVAFSKKVWPERPTSDDYFFWRYRRCPFQIGILAISNNSVVATVWAFPRSYKMDGEKTDFLETFDWFCLPSYRGTGVGIRVMQAMMNQNKPIIAVGGSPDTLSLLPRLKWSKLGDVRSYVFPSQLAGMTSYLHDRFNTPQWMSRFALGLPLALWKQFMCSKSLEIPSQKISVSDTRLSGLLSGEDFVPLPDPLFLEWLLKREGPSIVPLGFFERDQLIGWTLSRAHRSRHGFEVALHEVYAQSGFKHLYGSILFQTVKAFNSFKPILFRALASSPEVHSALRTNGFIPLKRLPVMVWNWQKEKPIPRSLHMTFNTSDALLMFHSLPNETE